MSGKNLLKILTWKWLLTTFMVIAATLVMVRLGFWQLDRLDKRRAFNARVLEQINKPVLDLNAELDARSQITGLDLIGMEYRQVVASGEYDFTYEVALRNQVHHDQYGVHLLTPLKINGSEAWVLVDRGWIPGQDFESGRLEGIWGQYQEKGKVQVSGVFRAAQEKPDFGRISDPVTTPGADRITAWNLTNIPQMQKQIPYPILPVYIQQSPDPSWAGMPYRSQPDLEITEGPHMGYAIQWFTFAAILFFGYPFFYARETRGTRSGEKYMRKSQVTPGERPNV